MDTGVRESRQQQAPADGTAVGGHVPEGATGSRAPQFVQSRRVLHLGWQAGVFLVGLAVVLTGVAMLPLPGPGGLVIFAGTAIWATEFVWAQLVLRWTKRKMRRGAGALRAARTRRRDRRGSGTTEVSFPEKGA